MTTLVTSAYKRPYYLERQLDGWLRCRGIEDIDRYVIALGASERLEDQHAVIKRFAELVPFPVDVCVDDPPQGPHSAIGKGIGRAFEAGAVFVFFTDEDTLPADDTLELISWARARFGEDMRVLSVNAHSECGQGWDGPYVRDDPDADPAVVRLKPYHNQWGWGTWVDRWEAVLAPEWDWDGRHRGCDWNIQRLLRDRGLLAVTPDASRTQHIGYRDGMFSSAATLAFSDAASFREHRDPVEFRVEEA
jgi:hypothetical protein